MAAVLRRYTDVLSLLDMIRHNRLSLLSPSRWYDQNDALGLQQYSARRGNGSVYALCLAEGSEQAHHWQIFSGHSHGLCIQFDRTRFVDFLNDSRPHVLHGPVVYQSLTEVRARNPIDLDILPFLKRDTFAAEKEYRIVAWEDAMLADETYAMRMPASLIKQVTFGPSMPNALARTLRDIAQDHDGCADIRFTISHLVNNESWASAIADGLASTEN